MAGYVYLSNFQDTTVANIKDVLYQHFEPFHPVYGLHKTMDELLEAGLLIEKESFSLPEENGQISHLNLNTTTGELFYTYTERELTPEERLMSEVAALEDELKKSDIENKQAIAELTMMIAAAPQA
ncbi:hypothetical protein D3C76_106180 [compost metagenome]